MLVLLPPKCFSWNLVLLVSCDSQELIKHESLIFISCSSTTFCGKPWCCCLLKMLKNHIKRRWVVVILIRILPAGQTLNATPQSKGRNYWWSEVFKNPSFLTSEVTLLSKKPRHTFSLQKYYISSSVFFWFVCGTKNALGVSAECLQSNKGSKRPKTAKKPLGLIKHPN